MLANHQSVGQRVNILYAYSFVPARQNTNKWLVLCHSKNKLTITCGMDAQRNMDACMRMNNLNFCMENQHIIPGEYTMFGIGGQRHIYIVSFIRRQTCRSGNNNGEIFFFYICGSRTCFLRLLRLREVPTVKQSKLICSLIVPAAQTSFLFLHHISYFA